MKRNELPSLDDLRAFETVARLGSVRAAADELSLTHGAVSRRIGKLARDLDLALFEKAGRGLSLTADGRKLADAATAALDRVSDTITELRSPTASRALILSCERSIAMRWLIPRLSRFHDAHPELVVHLSVGGGALDLATEGVTVALRRLDFALDPRWTVEPFCEEHVGPVVARDRLAAFEKGDYVALASRTRPKAWDEWFSRNPTVARPRSVQQFDHHFLMVEAAASGLGVAMAPLLVASDDVERERLVAPYGFTPDGSRYGLIRTSERAGVEGAERMIDWLRQEAPNG